MWPNVGFDGMVWMHYLRVIMLKKLEHRHHALHYYSKIIHPTHPIIPYIWSHEYPLQLRPKKCFNMSNVLELHNLWQSERKQPIKNRVKSLKDPPRLIETHLEPSETFHHGKAHDIKTWLKGTIVSPSRFQSKMRKPSVQYQFTSRSSSGVRNI